MSEAEAGTVHKSELHEQAHDLVIEGMAEVFWGLAWADVAERNDVNLSGTEITDVMPDIPERVNELSREWLDKLLDANKRTSTSKPTALALLFRAFEADCDQSFPEYVHQYGVRFGNCLAYEVQGHGVGWSDDHADCNLKIPHDCGEISAELEEIAQSQFDEDESNEEKETD